MGARAWPYTMALSCHSELVLSEAKDLAPVLSLSSNIPNSVETRNLLFQAVGC